MFKMFGKKQDKKKIVDDIVQVTKVYINGIPGDLNEKEAREYATKVMQEQYPDIPVHRHVIGENSPLPRLDVGLEGKRITLEPDGDTKVEWLAIGGVFTPIERQDKDETE